MFGYINASKGKITINTCDDGVVLTQNNSGSIELNLQDMEKLAKALFAKKKQLSSGLSSPSSSPSKDNVSSISNPANQTSAKNHMEEMKSQHKNAYSPWTEKEEEQLKKYQAEGKSTSEIANLLGRNEGAIISRKAKLGLS